MSKISFITDSICFILLYVRRNREVSRKADTNVTDFRSHGSQNKTIKEVMQTINNNNNNNKEVVVNTASQNYKQQWLLV